MADKGHAPRWTVSTFVLFSAMHHWWNSANPDRNLRTKIIGGAGEVQQLFTRNQSYRSPRSKMDERGHHH